MCPGNHESGGKRKSGRTRKGSKWLAANLNQAAEAAGRTKDTYLGAQFTRLRGRIGHAKAKKAVEHSILVAAFHILAGGVPYNDLGADWHQKRRPEAHARRLAHQIEALGYHVTIEATRSRLNTDHQVGTSSRAGLRPAPRPRPRLGYRVFGSVFGDLCPAADPRGASSAPRAAGEGRAHITRSATTTCLNALNDMVDSHPRPLAGPRTTNENW